MSAKDMKKRFREIIMDFRRIMRTEKQILKVGVVGELYIKYCHLGNWNLEKYLKGQNCEYYINGITWYALYYMVNTVKQEGFYCIDAYDIFKKRAEGYVTYRCSIGDGWLIGAEFANHALNGYNRIICGQPFLIKSRIRMLLSF